MEGLQEPRKSWPDSREFWPAKRVLVTGGVGFLGSYVAKELRRRGVEQVFVPRSKESDLRDVWAMRQLIARVRPDVVFHLAAHVGGIGANSRALAYFGFRARTPFEEGLRHTIRWYEAVTTATSARVSV